MTTPKILECPVCNSLLRYIKDINGFLSYTCPKKSCNVYDLRIMTPDMHERFKE